MTPLLPADFTQPSLQTILRINLDGTCERLRLSNDRNRVSVLLLPLYHLQLTHRPVHHEMYTVSPLIVTA